MGVIVVHAGTAASPAEVWAVLADPRLFAAWVVGAACLERADATWPTAGSTMDYRFGAWPGALRARTVVRAGRAGRELALHGDLGRLGGIDVVVRVRPEGAGSALTIEEDVTGGPGALVPRPLRAAAIRVRNRETLRRLALVAEATGAGAGRRGPQTAPDA